MWGKKSFGFLGSSEMVEKKRHKTSYPGVFYIHSSRRIAGKPERIYYIRYRKEGCLIEEKAGKQRENDMTPAKASALRSKRIQGELPSNKEQRARIIAEQSAEANRWTVDKIWNEYIKGNSTLKGIVQDSNRYKKYIQPQFGNKELKDILSLDVVRLRRNLEKSKKTATVNHIFELLRRISNFAASKKLCVPLDFKIKLPAVDNEKTECLKDKEISNLLKAISDDPHPVAGNIMLMALYTGMRRSEIFKLRWNDIDFDHDQIRIRNPKGKKSQNIPLSSAAKNLLLSLPRGDNPFVFLTRKGKEIKDIHNQINRIKRQAGLPADFRPLHGLRHTFASLLASSGKVDMYTLQKLLTHKSPQMTQRYAHLRDDVLKKASELAGNIIAEIDQQSSVTSNDHSAIIYLPSDVKK